jgi:GDP-mannose 6-dehydrogenase
VMEIFCQDHKLNLSSYYLKPGFAFGGSCLPKDVRALAHQARALDVETPVLGSILLSNRLQVAKAVDMVLRTGRRNIGVLGLSFKPGTDDLRESPLVALIETLLGKGLHLRIYDREVELARLAGANKEFIERGIPHISSLLCPRLDEVVSGAEVLVVGKRDAEFETWAGRLPAEQLLIDLVQLPQAFRQRPNYQLIC